MLSHTEELVGYPGDVGEDLAALGKYETGSRQCVTTYIVATRVIISAGEASRVRAYIVARR